MAEYKEQDNELVFALDIGTRSVVGVVGKPVDGRLEVLAIEVAEHGKRTMLDGQIDDIMGVAAVVKTVTERLESQLEVNLKRVCVAAAGRALRTQRGSFAIELPSTTPITMNDISQMEAGAVSEAERALQEDGEAHRQFYLVGYTVAQYRLDNYPLTTLLSHSGRRAEVDVVATFLPGEVVESLYSAMREAGLQVVSLTLEPIAAMNAVIPAELRLLNLALVDIGAGTSDIALCRDGSVVGYTMVTQAGDEITETIMRALLVDFQMAEYIKRAMEVQEEITYTNVLGIEETVSAEAVFNEIVEPMQSLADAIAQQIIDVNGGVPSALFMAGGGSKLSGLREKIVSSLGIDEKRVALAGNNFSKSAFSDKIDINNAEYATPLGIAISTGMKLLNDSYIVLLNGQPAKLFRSGVLMLRDILLMNGYTYDDLVGKNGKSLNITLDGHPMIFRGEPSAPAILRVNGKDEPITTLINAGDEIEFIPAKHGESAQKTLADLLGEDFRGRVLVNNKEASLNTQLHQGDVVLALERYDLQTDVEKELEPEPERLPEPPAPVITPKKLNVFLNDELLELPGKADGEPYYLMDLLEYSGIDFKNLDRNVKMEVNGRECNFQHVLRERDSVIIRPE